MTRPGLARVPEPAGAGPDGDDLLRRVARGDEAAFGRLYDLLSSRVYGLVLRVLRDPGRYDASKGSAAAWVCTIAHRRAVDRVRAEQAGADRARKVAAASAEIAYDEVAEQAAARMERVQVRRCLDGLTDLQREALTLAYYGGHTYREVAELLDAALPTIKTRMRDGLIRMRDCLGVAGR